MTKQEFLQLADAAAAAGAHVFPAYAACEAAEESAFGASHLAIEANNLFGQKYPARPPAEFAYPKLSLPTHEWSAELRQMVPASADWPIFPDWATCFQERMRLLERLAPEEPDYAAALQAPNGETFVRSVSRTWATDPQRAANVLAIYAEFRALLEPTGAAG